MTGLETVLAAVGSKILGEELINWLRNRGDGLSEDDWSELGLLVGRKLSIDYENVKASWLHKSRKRSIVNRIESAAGIYRELELIGENREFDEEIIEKYSELADVCSNWSIETAGLTQDDYEMRGEEFFEIFEEYNELID